MISKETCTTEAVGSMVYSLSHCEGETEKDFLSLQEHKVEITMGALPPSASYTDTVPLKRWDGKHQTMEHSLTALQSLVMDHLLFASAADEKFHLDDIWRSEAWLRSKLAQSLTWS